ncbi:MAG: hypothetical protein EOO67_10590 [Microbacterium sp.]|nr:MAG: hypothetical protein EOO67_10590 [Microbacterium sp.]
MTAPLRRDAKFLALGFLGSGTVHLVRPDVWEPLMPDWVPAHREVIIWSGVAEIACAAGLLFPPTRKVAGLASAALLAGVYVGNVKMAVDASKSDNLPLKAAAYARLPLQFPMIRAALRAARS